MMDGWVDTSSSILDLAACISRDTRCSLMELLCSPRLGKLRCLFDDRSSMVRYRPARSVRRSQRGLLRDLQVQVHRASSRRQPVSVELVVSKRPEVDCSAQGRRRRVVRSIKSVRVDGLSFSCASSCAYCTDVSLCDGVPMERPLGCSRLPGCDIPYERIDVNVLTAESALDCQ